MTVKDLIEKLKEYPEDMLVLGEAEDGLETVEPFLERRDFLSSYYTGTDFISLPKGTEFVILR